VLICVWLIRVSAKRSFWRDIKIRRFFRLALSRHRPGNQPNSCPIMTRPMIATMCNLTTKVSSVDRTQATGPPYSTQWVLSLIVAPSPAIIIMAANDGPSRGLKRLFLSRSLCGFCYAQMGQIVPARQVFICNLRI